MAKKKIHIDELFRRELGDMKMPVDTNDWAAMQAQIAAEQNKRKRRALWWWFTGIALLVVGSLAIYYFLSSASTPQKEVIVENATSTPSIETPKADNTPTPIETETENNTSNDINSNEENITNNPTETPSSLPLNTQTPSSSKEISEKKTPTTPKSKKSQPDLTITKKDKTAKGNKDIDKGTDKKDGDKETPQPKKDKNIIPDEIPNPTVIIKPADSSETKTPENNIVATPDSAKINNDSLKQAKQEKKPKKDKDGSKLKLPPFSLGFSLGGTSNSFTADENSTFSRILNNGNQPALGFNALLSANYAIKNFEINSGFGINSITNSGSYNYTHQTKDSIPVLDPLGNIIGYFYTNFRDTTHNFNLTSRFTSITLPIGVSYKISLGDNAGLRLGANTSINYLIGTSGDYINPFNLFKLDVGDNKDLFRTWNIGLGGSVGYYYQLKNGLTLEGSINYNTLTNGIFDNRIGTAIRPSSIGVNVGIRYNFKLRK